MRIFEDQMVSKEGPRPNMKVETLNFDHKETLFETRAAALEWLKFNGILVSYIGNAYRIFKLEFHLIKKRFDLQFYYFLFSSSLSSLKTWKKSSKWLVRLLLHSILVSKAALLHCGLRPLIAELPPSVF